MQPQTQPSPAQPVDHDLSRMLVDNETRRLLVHLDSQEAAMLAIRSLLTDMASENLSTADRRRLKTRLDAATQLTQKLNAERSQILAEIASHVPDLTEELRLSQLAAYVSKNLRPSIAAARQRLSHLATQLSRQSATVRLIQGEERRINSMAYQLATGMVGSDRYDASGRKSVQPAAVHFDVRS
jgi:Na+/phosphate symporter